LDNLIKIKRLVLAGRMIFTAKSRIEMWRNHITIDMVREAIVSASIIQKTIRSTSPGRKKREHLYVILGQTWSGVVIYTKGKIEIKNGKEKFYVIISAKHSLD